MRVACFPEPRRPEEVPVAGVTLLDLLGEPAAPEEAVAALGRVRHRPPGAVVHPGDEVRRFRTPAWTWGAMAGMEGLAVLRSGRVAFWVLTRMN